MNTNRTVLSCFAVIASLTLGGCGCERDLKYKDVQIAELERLNKELGDQLRTAIPGATTSEREMELVISIENNVLFRPGSADLSTSAKNTLSHAIALINEKYKNHYVRVEGHTDDQKITRSKDKWDDNWDLSGGRSQKVLHYLLEHGIAASNLGFAGYADQRPLAPNSSEAARAKNRRVDIVVIPKR
jgi:chemotaxis protein MotB